MLQSNNSHDRRATAWSSPLIVAAAAAPTFAASTAVLIPTVDINGSCSTRCGHRHADGMPAPQVVVIAVNVAVTGAGVTGLTCKITFVNGFRPSAVSVHADGWTSSPPVGSQGGLKGGRDPQASWVIFDRAVVAAAHTDVPLRITIRGTIDPHTTLTLQFSAPATPAPPPLTVKVDDINAFDTSLSLSAAEG